MAKKGKKSKGKDAGKASKGKPQVGAAGAAKAKPADNRTLPSKEATLWKTVVKCYETKQHKKGIKSADTILKKFPDHGETLAMKGLILNAMGKKEEATELIKTGLKNDMRSHVCWHVYGLLHRSDRDYKQAIKCYSQALRIDKENKQILNDLAMLQVQTRDTKGYVESRRRMLTLKPSQRNNWMGFITAHHMRGNLDMAVNLMSMYENTLDEKRAFDYEESEMVLFKNRLIEETGELDKCYGHLLSVEKRASDRQGWLERKAMVLARLGRFDEARETYEALLELNNENYAYHRGYITSRLATAEGLAMEACDLPIRSAAMTLELRAALTAVYKAWQVEYPRSNAIRRILLDVITGQASEEEEEAGGTFRDLVDQYLKRSLRRGVPSLFGDVKPLYQDAGKAAAISGLLDEYLSTLKTDGTLPSEGKAAEGKAAEGTGGPGAVDKESPEILCWTLMFAAQHYDFLGDHVRALAMLDEAIAHTPTNLDLYRIKGRVVKHMGDVAAGSVLVERARAMDLADRYINTKSVKYLLRSHQISAAEKVVTLFTKHDYAEPLQNLVDMQVMWYELEAGEAYERMGDYGRALKQFSHVERHFRDFREDQLDFHSYCLRKMTLRAYADFIRMEDRIHGHRFFVRAARGLARCYRAVHETRVEGGEDESAPDLAGMDAAARKKAKQLLRLQKKKEEEEERAQREAKEKAAKAASAGKAKAKGKIEVKEKDDDPLGEKLIAAGDPLKEAHKYIALLGDFRGDEESSHIIAFDNAVRRRKPLLALRSLRRARRVAAGQDATSVTSAAAAEVAGVGGRAGAAGAATPTSPEVFERVALFFFAIANPGAAGAGDAPGAVCCAGAETDGAAAAAIPAIGTVSKLGGRYAGWAPTSSERAWIWGTPPFLPDVGALHPAVATAVKDGLEDPALLGGETVEEYIESYVTRAREAGSSAYARVAAARVLLAVRPEKGLPGAVALLSGEGGLDVGTVSHGEAKAVHQCLRCVLQRDDLAADWGARCLARFPASIFFGGKFKLEDFEEPSEGEEDGEEDKEPATVVDGTDSTAA